MKRVTLERYKIHGSLTGITGKSMKNPVSGKLYLVVSCVIFIIGMTVPLPVQGGTTTRVSVASDGTQGTACSAGRSPHPLTGDMWHSAQNVSTW